MDPQLATILTGLCLLFGAFSLGTRHILSDPAHRNYPSAPSWRRKIMWGYMLALAGVGRSGQGGRHGDAEPRWRAGCRAR
jgi:hypothetical protein